VVGKIILRVKRYIWQIEKKEKLSLEPGFLAEMNGGEPDKPVERAPAIAIGICFPIVTQASCIESV